MKNTAVALACLTLISTVFAQEAPVGGPSDGPARTPGSRLDRVDIIAKTPSDNDLRRRAKVAKQVYGREEMDKYGDTNVADVLKRLPGVTMQGNAPRMRGLGSGYTLVLINGDPAPPGFALDQLDPSQVERIEVAKAPTADQSAQAVAGSINIILKEAPKVSQRDLRIGVGYNVDKPTVSGSFTIGEKWDNKSLSLPISVFQWRGLNQNTTERYQPGLDGAPALSTQSADMSFFGHGFNMGPRLNWKISDDENLTWQSFLQRGVWNNQSRYTNQVGSGNPSLDDNNDIMGTWQNVRSNLQWVNHLSGSDRIELKAGLQASKGTFDFQSVRAGDPQLRAVGDNGESGVTQGGNYTRLLNDAHSLTAGWDLEWRQRDEKRDVSLKGVPQTTEYEGQPFSARIERQALFVQDEWEIDKQWSTYLGVRGERIQTRSQGVGTDIDNISSVVTPMWHLNYKLTPEGKDMVRASVTRSYKAPGLGQIVARPAISGLFPDTSKTNTELSPDRVGNSGLLPELATGLDVAYEKYLSGGGMVSIGVFYRDINNLIRNVTSLQTVSYSPVQRWVSQPTNFSKASTSGVELEVKGRAGELFPSLFDPKLGLNLRTALNYYHSNVEALPGPNNRLDGQQPWSGNVGFDYRTLIDKLPVTVGGTLGFTPGYTTQQSQSQSAYQSRTRSIDVFVQMVFSRTLSARISANNLMPLETQSQTFSTDGYSSSTLNRGRTNYQAGVEIKF
ncbi:MAG: TonB-dependent receptor [Rhodoferax sp.]|nr:TonB-dependent receptor [Rhodoferax sp.]